MSTPTSPTSASNATNPSLENGVQNMSINQQSTATSVTMDSVMEEAPPKLDSKNPESIKEFIQFLQAKATKLTDELFNVAFAPSTDESEKDDSARLKLELDQCEVSIMMLERRLENMGCKSSSPNVTQTASSDVIKKPTQIPITEFLSFDLDFWKSYHLDPTVLNTIKTGQSKDVFTFLDKFEDLFEQYQVPVDTHWYRYMSKLIGECSYSRIFQFAFKEKKKNMNGKQVPFEWVKTLLTTRFDHSLERDAATSRYNVYAFVPRGDETFEANLTRYHTLLDWAGIDTQNCFDQCYFFLVSFKGKFRQELLNTMLDAAREAKLPVAHGLSVYAPCPTTKVVLDQLVPVNFHAFLGHFATKWEHLNDEWRKFNKSKPTVEKTSSKSPSGFTKAPAKSSDGKKPQYSGSKRTFSDNRSDSDKKRARRDRPSSSSAPILPRIKGNCDKCRLVRFNKEHFDACDGPYGHRKHDPLVEPEEATSHTVNLALATSPSSNMDDSNPPSSTFSVDNYEDEYTTYLRNLDDHALGNDILLEDSYVNDISNRDASCYSISRSSHTIGDIDNPLSLTNSDVETLTPLIIQGTKLFGILDPGSSVSIIHKTLADKLQIKYKPVNGSLQFIDGGKVNRYQTLEPLAIEYDSVDHTVLHHFDVIENSSTLSEQRVLLGRDLIPRLGVVLYTNLAYKFKSDSLQSVDDSIDDKAYIPNVTPAGSIKEQATFTHLIKPHLEANAKINSSSFCNLKEAVVYLRTPPGEFAHVRQYPIPYVYRDKVMDEINRMLKDGVIVPAIPSQWNLPITVTPKKDLDGKLTKIRLVLDPRMLNKMLPVDRFPLPLIDEIFQALSGCNTFSCLDLFTAFLQFPLNEEDCHKTTFTAPNGLQYMYKGAPYGLSIISQQFSRVLIKLLGHLEFVRCFVDDIVIFSKSVHAHYFHVKAVVEILTKANLRLNLDKCVLAKSSVYLLGYCISTEGKSIDPRKLTNVMEWKQPASGKQVQQFLGVINFFRSHVPKVSFFTKPLDDLRSHDPKKHGPFPWNSTHTLCFNTLKKALANHPVLSHPQEGVPFSLGTDASSYAISAVLFQDIEVIDDDGHKTTKRNYIGFMARTLSKSEQKYSVTMKELCAVVYALRQFHKFIYGTQFLLFSDHRSLCYIHTQKNLNSMLIKWLDVILDYTFTVVYIKGIDNILPDNLSRLFEPFQPDMTVGLGEGDMAKRLPYIPNNASTTSINKRKLKTVRKLKRNLNLKSKDAKVFYLQSSQAIHPQYFTPPEEEHEKLLSEMHDKVGHYGAEQIVKKLHREGIHWLKLIDDAIEFVRKCPDCQRHNIQQKGYHPMRGIYSYIPGDHWHIDLAGPIDPDCTTSQNNYFMVLVDSCTRYCIVKPILNKKPESILHVLVNVFSDFGYPSILVSDNGTEFKNKDVKDFTDLMKIEHRFITPLKASTNGLAERYVQSVKRMLAKVTRGIGNHWDYHLPSVQLAINNRVSRRLQTSPFSLMFARKMNDRKGIRFAQDSDGTKQPMSTDELLARINFMSDIVFPALNNRTAAQIELEQARFNNSHKLVSFKPESYVMIKLPGKAPQLSPSYVGPCKVVRQTRGGSYLLRDETGTLMPRDYAPYELKSVSKEEIIQGDSKTEKSYEVEAIIDHRGKEGQHEYLVRWKNYSSDWDDWLKPEMFNDTEIIRKYWKRLGAPHKPKKGNVITNAPPSIPKHNDLSEKVHLGTVARIYNGIEMDIDDLFPDEAPSSSSSSSSLPKKRKYKCRNHKGSKPLRKSQRLSHKDQARHLS
jgi:hypothetical protein